MTLVAQGKLNSGTVLWVGVRKGPLNLQLRGPKKGGRPLSVHVFPFNFFSISFHFFPFLIIVVNAFDLILWKHRFQKHVLIRAPPLFWPPELQIKEALISPYLE